MRHVVAPFVFLLLAACSDSAQEQIAVDLLLSGTAPETSELSGGGTIELEAAELAFGPLYLCAGSQSGELCESARLEWLDSALVDVLDEEPLQAGRLEGLSGEVRSWMYDHAFTSTRSSPRPLELDAATQLDHNSVRLSGIVHHDSLAIPFQTQFVIAVSEEVEPGFPVVRSSTPVDLKFSTDSQSLEIQFQTASWLSALRLSDFYQELDCDGENMVSCQGQVQQSCDESGALLSEIDCTDTAEVCVPRVGCAESVELTPESRAVRALKQEILAGTRPDFRVR